MGSRMQQAERPGEVIGAYHAALEPFWHPVLPADSLSNRPTADTFPERIRFVKDSSAGTCVIWQAACPVFYDRSLILSRQARSFGTDPARDPEYERLQDTILQQDRPIVESQRPGLLPPSARA
ncbi:MAG TPA: hypothetical protein VKA51_00990 [Rubrobacteraceae bacterium]|nr:hypothetical protein [Rubrobacteraceae bacterium]